MADIQISSKESPFTPGRPVQPEYFVARINEIQRLDRAIKQTITGRNENVFITGQRGIGKSSLAGFIRYIAEKQYSLIGSHCFLGSAGTLEARNSSEALQVADEYSGGRKYIDPQISNVLRSKTYSSILWRIGKKLPIGVTLKRQELLKENAPEKERKNLDNFLNKIKKLGIMQDADVRGEYRFVNPLYHLYLWYEAKNKIKNKTA